jgi:hypothetical protein
MLLCSRSAWKIPNALFIRYQHWRIICAAVNGEKAMARNIHPDLIVIRTYQTEIDADVAKTALDAAGIKSLVRSDNSGGLNPGLAFTRGVQLLVASDDVKRANAVLTPEK